MTEPARLIIDTDPGVDDAFALLMAFGHPSVHVEAITTVAGNVSLEQTTRNACAIADVAGASVPIFAGAAGPLIGQRHDAAEVHGADGLGDAGRSASERVVEEMHATQAVIELTREMPGMLTLVALGPLTNLALAARLDPGLPHRLAATVVMGGAHRATGNASAVAEFNVFADPEAAAIVFATWPHMTLVTWESTLAHPLPRDFYDDATRDTPAARFLREISAHTFGYIREFLGSDDLYVPDPLAMAVALEPDIVQRQSDLTIDVELSGQLTRGQTVAHDGTFDGRTPKVQVVEEVDRRRLNDLLLLALG